MKEKTDKLDFTTIQDCSVKDTVKRIKRQAICWEKIFSKHIPDKELVPTQRTLRIQQ